MSFEKRTSRLPANIIKKTTVMVIENLALFTHLFVFPYDSSKLLMIFWLTIAPYNSIRFNVYMGNAALSIQLVLV
jgi:hypothetical protein